MKLVAIDPGYTESAWCIFSDGKPERWMKQRNTDLLAALQGQGNILGGNFMLAIEMVASYGMPVGREVFETCLWIGRFIEAWKGRHVLIYRKDVKTHLCRDSRAKDSNIRQALIDRFGPGKEKAIGKKKTPGPLYGMSGDCWSALAVAVTAQEALARDRVSIEN